MPQKKLSHDEAHDYGMMLYLLDEWHIPFFALAFVAVSAGAALLESYAMMWLALVSFTTIMAVTFVPLTLSAKGLDDLPLEIAFPLMVGGGLLPVLLLKLAPISPLLPPVLVLTISIAVRFKLKDYDDEALYWFLHFGGPLTRLCFRILNLLAVGVFFGLLTAGTSAFILLQHSLVAFVSIIFLGLEVLFGEQLNMIRGGNAAQIPTLIITPFSVLLSIPAAVVMFRALVTLTYWLVRFLPEPQPQADAPGVTVSTWEAYWIAAHRDQSIFLGLDVETKKAVCIKLKDCLEGNTFLCGKMRSGKSEKGVYANLIQLLEFEEVVVIVIDCKGEAALRAGTEMAARRRMLPFRFFSSVKKLQSVNFNFFSQLSIKSLSPLELAEILLLSLGLLVGGNSAYGSSWFIDCNLQLLLEGLNLLYRDDQWMLKDWKTLHQALSKAFEGPDKKVKGKGKKKVFDALHVLFKVHHLGYIPELNTNLPGWDRETIDWMRVLENREVCYFHLPVASMPLTGRDVLKLVLFSLLSAVQDRMYSGRNIAMPRSVVVCIDEPQELLSEAFSTFATQARSLGIHLEITAQSPSQLVGRHLDLKSILLDTSNTQIFYSLPRDMEEEIIRRSGKVIKLARGWKSVPTLLGPILSDIYTREVEGTKLEQDDLNQINRSTGLSILVADDKTTAQDQASSAPVVIETIYPDTPEGYDNRKNTPWPLRNPQTDPSGDLDYLKDIFAQFKEPPPEEEGPPKDEPPHDPKPPTAPAPPPASPEGKKKKKPNNDDEEREKQLRKYRST